ncbi:MAG: L,D-transpeptidase, partial [Anaerotignum sp.]|nr:L,D-transpeptidase [Anaerotignum sp.]
YMKKKIIGMLLFCLLLVCTAPVAMAAEREEYPYYVTVNLTDNIVTVYEKDEAGNYTVPRKAFLCSVGESTPEGTFQTMVKYDWRYLFGDVWGQYATRITGHYLFHSVPYFEKDKTTLEYEEYNKLGTTASMGCIRLTVKDAKWLYDNCPVGTTVKMYRGDVEEPLQPEAVQKINVNDTKRRGWDPTDPDPANPWKKGEVRSLVMEDAVFSPLLEAYYENGTYYLHAQDAKKMFSRLDVKLQLPEDAAQVVDGEMVMEYNGETKYLTCRVYEGTVYYKIRDLATMVGAEMSWNGETKAIGIRYGEKETVAVYTPDVRDVASFPMRMASFFLNKG